MKQTEQRVQDAITAARSRLAEMDAIDRRLGLAVPQQVGQRELLATAGAAIGTALAFTGDVRRKYIAEAICYLTDALVSA